MMKENSTVRPPAWGKTLICALVSRPRLDAPVARDRQGSTSPYCIRFAVAAAADDAGAG